MFARRFAALLLLYPLSCTAATKDLTSLVNLFIGTETGANGGSGGNAFPGSAIPHAMSKVGIDVDIAPRQAGYISQVGNITGISLLHDEGTGGNTNGGYGNFPLFPISSCTFETCPVGINARKLPRVPGTDSATPGYFTTVLNNGARIEATSTRRAGLIRFTFANGSSPHVVVDLTNDLQRSFLGGSLTLDPVKGRVQLGGTFFQSYGPSNYTVFGCYDFQQAVSAYGTYSNASAVTPNTTSLSFPFVTSPVRFEAGALFSFASNANNTVLARYGVSFLSSAQACSNAEEEVSTWDWTAVQSASQAKWEDVLSRVEVDPARENATVITLLYSSLYRSALVPANLTGENPYWDNTHPFFDALFCSWDTFRTVHPLLSLIFPEEWGNIVSSYVDGWRHTGFIPECRANTKPGYVQGGSDGMPILGDFAVKYGARAAELGVNSTDLWQALVDTAENTPPDWLTVGRQNTAWKIFDYIPTAYNDPDSTGLETREASRTLEYALGDFAVRQAGLALKRPASVVSTYENRSMNFLNIWDPNVTSDGFTGFAQRRFPNGTFAFSDPVACSPLDTVGHSCARGADNNVGFYESSSWEYSFFAPHSIASVIKLMGGTDTFLSRVDHYFDKGYFLAGNEPSFAIPWVYHYANRPDKSALRVREVVFKNFNTGIGGLPGNDDSGAMASLLVFHILGLYPVPASTQLLIGSPLVSAYTLRNAFYKTTTNVRVQGFDKSSLTALPSNSSRVYVESITINGKKSQSRCWISFDDLVKKSSNVVIAVTNNLNAAMGCGKGRNALPDSLSTGGFKG